MALRYNEEVDKNNTLKLRKMLANLPESCSTFMRGIEQRTESRTRIAYAYDLSVFFTYLRDEVSRFHGKQLTAFTLEDIESITVLEIEKYVDTLKYRVRQNPDGSETELLNSPSGIKRKLSSSKSFYRYLYKDQLIQKNPAELVDMPKLRDHDIIRFDDNEVADFLDEVDSGDQLTERQAKYHAKTGRRDSAMMNLMLGTGIRVSECVGLNINDVDFNNDGIRIHRKGGKEVTVYFGDEVERELRSYMEYRKTITALPGHEEALFLSMQKKRISVNAVENLVKKYAKVVTPLKHITPHKLRSTYGTNLYKETGDIYLVADVLGHNDVNTTKKHYAALEDERRRSARNKVHLRED